MNSIFRYSVMETHHMAPIPEDLQTYEVQRNFMLGECEGPVPQFTSMQTTHFGISRADGFEKVTVTDVIGSKLTTSGDMRDKMVGNTRDAYDAKAALDDFFASHVYIETEFSIARRELDSQIELMHTNAAIEIEGADVALPADVLATTSRPRRVVAAVKQVFAGMLSR